MSELNAVTASPEHGVPELSRRRLLAAGFAGISATAVPASIGFSVSSAAAALPTVRPISSQVAYSALGVCALPHRVNSPYLYVSQWIEALSQTGASYFRGMYDHEISATAEATRAARSHAIKWGMTVCPDLSFSDSTLVARIKHIAANAADICLFIEGINEPNYDPATGTVPAGWARRTVAKQRLIWQTAKGDSRLSHAKILGPKLQATVGTESHYQALGAAGIAQYMDFAALACYPGGMYPYSLLDQRLGWIGQYWGGKPAWITETGYTNALAATRGHAVVPEDVAAIYAPSLLLEAVEHGCLVSVFELLDSPDGAVKDHTEANFGLFAMQVGEAPPWRAKPIVSALRSLLSGLKDPGPAYTPAPISLSVTSSASDVQSTVTAKRNGSATVHLRRAKNCWDPVSKSPLAVPEVAVRIRTAQSTRTVMVDHHVRAFSL
jgi:hypothetical protein